MSESSELEAKIKTLDRKGYSPYGISIALSIDLQLVYKTLGGVKSQL